MTDTKFKANKTKIQCYLLNRELYGSNPLITTYSWSKIKELHQNANKLQIWIECCDTRRFNLVSFWFRKSHTPQLASSASGFHPLAQYACYLQMSWLEVSTQLHFA